MYSSEHTTSILLDHEDANCVDYRSFLDAVCDQYRTSSLFIPQNNVFVVKSTRVADGYHLHLVTARFIAEHIVSLSRPGGTVVVIAVDPLWTPVIRTQAAKREYKISIVTSQVLRKQVFVALVNHNSFYLYSHQKLPNDASIVADLSNHSHDKLLVTRTDDILHRSGVRTYDTDTFFRKESTDLAPGRGSGQHHNKIENWLDNVDLAVTHQPPIYEVLCPHDIAERAAHRPSTIIDWTADNVVHIPIPPVTMDMHFHPEKSHLIIGSSSIAHALCGWMVASGARYSSSRPACRS